MLEKILSLILFSSVCVTGLNVTLLKIYDAKTCKNEPSCYLVNEPGLPSDRRSLRKRVCMCDDQCVKYRDCCTDSNYYNELEQSLPQSFYCQPTVKVYMIIQCPETWTDPEVAFKCYLSMSRLHCNDTTLIIPVTNTATNTTYGNQYCAQCHGDNDHHPWTLSPSCGEAPSGLLLEPESTNEPTSEPTTESAGVRYSRSVQNMHPSEKKHQKLQHKFSTEIGSEYITALLRYMRRRKRETKVEVDFNKYARKADEIFRTARYDQHSGFFVAKYNEMDLICQATSKLPKALKRHCRSCVPHLIETCDEGSADKELETLCHNHTSIVYDKHDNKAYRNKYCAKCHAAELDSLTGCPINVRDETGSSTTTAYSAK